MEGIKQLFKRYKLWNTYQEQRALILWPQVTGNKIGRLTCARRLSRGTLLVEVSSTTVAQELAFLEEQYRTRLNDLLGKHVVERIRFTPGHFPRPRVRKSISVSPEDRKNAKALFSQLEDRKLRDSFERLYLSLRQREQELLASGGKRCPRCGAVFNGDGDICPGCRFDEIAQQNKGD
jgi:predicted Zn-ribbon and HTH transcriptional regulator